MEHRKRTPQTTEGLGEPTYAPMLNKSMAEIDWKKKNGSRNKKIVRGLNGIMGAYTIINDKKYKLLKVQVIDNQEFLNRFNCDNGMLNKKETKDKFSSDNEKLNNINSLNSKESGEVILADAKKDYS